MTKDEKIVLVEFAELDKVTKDKVQFVTGWYNPEDVPVNDWRFIMPLFEKVKQLGFEIKTYNTINNGAQYIEIVHPVWKQERPFVLEHSYKNMMDCYLKGFAEFARAWKQYLNTQNA